MDEHGYVMATIPATTAKSRRADDRLHRARRHVARDERRRREADRPPRTTTAATWCCRTTRRPCCGWRTIPALAEQMGHDIVTASGTTLLGADNKAGVAEIVTAADYLIAPSRDPARRDPDRLHARRGDRPRHAALRRRQRSAPPAPTRMDGGSRGEVESESFSADAMTVTFHGFNTHPGYAKGRMVNAIKVAAAFIDRAAARIGCRRRRPTATTASSTRTSLQAGVERTSVKFLVRDFQTAGPAGQGSAASRRWPERPWPRIRARASRSPIEESIPEHEGGARSPSRRRPPTPARRCGAPASRCARARFAAAPTARGCRSWGCRRRTSSPASTTSTRGSNGSRCRTWKRRSK